MSNLSLEKQVKIHENLIRILDRIELKDAWMFCELYDICKASEVEIIYKGSRLVTHLERLMCNVGPDDDWNVSEYVDSNFEGKRCCICDKFIIKYDMDDEEIKRANSSFKPEKGDNFLCSSCHSDETIFKLKTKKVTLDLGDNTYNITIYRNK